MKTIQLLITSTLMLLLSLQNVHCQLTITVSKEASGSAKLVNDHSEPFDHEKVEIEKGLIFTYHGEPAPDKLIANVTSNNSETEEFKILPEDGTTTFELDKVQHLNNVQSLEIWFKFGNDKWPKDGITLKSARNDNSNDGTENNGENNTGTNLLPHQIIFPISRFTDDSLEKTKRTRILILDRNADRTAKINATMYKAKDNGLKPCKSLPNNSSISVLTRHNSLKDITAVSVSINETNYIYSKGLNDLIDWKKKEAKDDENEDDKPKTQSGGGDAHFQQIKNDLDSIEHVSFSDLQLIRTYQQNLERSYTNNAKLYESSAGIIGEILAWNPDYVELTTLPISAEEADEIEIIVGLTREGESKESTYRVGNYKTSGGIAFHVNGSIFLTNLVDRDVFTEDVPVADNEGDVQRFARLDDSDNPLNLGVGANGELSFRTGSLIRPTINIGVFVPFEQDISPFFATGIGFSLGGEKVRLGISGGLAFGQVNEIKSEYKDKDLSTFSNLTNENLAKKVWKQGYQFAIGLSFNVN